MFSQITVDEKLSQLHRSIFPDVTDMNGMFGQKALWYGLKTGAETGAETGANASDSVIAFCTVGVVDKETIFLYNVGVVEPYRHKGYGRQLVENIIQLYGRSNICLFVDKNNLNAIKLYRKCGFKHTNRLYVAPLDHICMRRVGK